MDNKYIQLLQAGIEQSKDLTDIRLAVHEFLLQACLDKIITQDEFKISIKSLREAFKR